jgi:proteasome accessory factor B
MHPLERLLNLVALLLDTRRPLTFEEIRDRVPAYGHGDEASAKRMFERDKDTLREAGIPVELEATDAWDVEKGYRIPHEAYYLPAIAFSQDELWALFVAAHTPGSDGEAEMAFQKLSSGADTDVLPILAAGEPTPGVDVSGPHLPTVADALARRRALRFRYRPLHGRAGQRTVDPFTLVFRNGSWYLVGNDRERKDVRSFRLSRVQSEMRDAGDAIPAPEGFDATSHLESGPWGIGKPAETARVGFTPRIAWLVIAQTAGATVLRTRRDGWVEIEVPASQSEAFVSWVLSFGPDARVFSPRTIRDHVVARLDALAGSEPRA